MIEVQLPVELASPGFARVGRGRIVASGVGLGLLLVDKQSGRVFRWPGPALRETAAFPSGRSVAVSNSFAPLLVLSKRLFLEPRPLGRLALYRGTSAETSLAWRRLMEIGDLVDDMDDHTDFMSYVRGHLSLTGLALRDAVLEIERALWCDEAFVRGRVPRTIELLAEHLRFHDCMRPGQLAHLANLRGALRRAADREPERSVARRLTEGSEALRDLPRPRPGWDESESGLTGGMLHIRPPED